MTQGPTGPARLHHFDAARALFMLLGVPYHAALAYAPGSHWLLVSPDPSAFLGGLAFVSQSFRMPGFFLIAGFFAAMLLARRGAASWLRSRAVRLGVPFMTAILLLLLPLQHALLGAARRGTGDLWHDVAGPFDHPLDYLWFLPCLLMLCCALVIVWRPLAAAAHSAFAQKLFALPLIWPLLGLVAGLWLAAMQWLAGRLGDQLVMFGGYVDFEQPLANLPWFGIGLLCALAPALRDELERFRWSNALAALAALSVYAMLDGNGARAAMIAADVAAGIAALSITACLFALLARALARPSPTVRRWVDASLTIYLVHHPLVVAMALAAAFMALPPLLEWAAITGAVLALSYAAHRIVTRSRLWSFLLNGIPMTRDPRRGVLTAAGTEGA